MGGFAYSIDPLRQSSADVISSPGVSALVPDVQTPLGAGRKVRNPFTDVLESDWFYDDVMYTYSKGLIKGTTKTQFGSEAPVTRGMLVTILYRDAGNPEVADMVNPFADIAAGEYYYAPVLWAAANGIVYGGDDGLYAPNDAVTRQQLAAILYRYALYSGFTLAKIDKDQKPDDLYGELCGYFKDANEFYAYTWTPIMTMAKTGIMIGDPGGRFNPNDFVTRAQTAAVLHRYHEIVELLK